MRTAAGHLGVLLVATVLLAASSGTRDGCLTGLFYEEHDGQEVTIRVNGRSSQATIDGSMAQMQRGNQGGFVSAALVALCGGAGAARLAVAGPGRWRSGQGSTDARLSLSAASLRRCNSTPRCWPPANITSEE